MSVGYTLKVSVPQKIRNTPQTSVRTGNGAALPYQRDPYQPPQVAQARPAPHERSSHPKITMPTSNIRNTPQAPMRREDAAALPDT